MATVKYIAAGFVQDAEKLLTEFVKENSTEFKVFTHFWKKHNFSAVYLGRSAAELQQFTQEIFQLTLKFVVATDILHQIGGVFLLYALFRNQIVEPPTKIRIVLQQYQHFLEMRKLAVKERYIHLHYVIGYLVQNAFDYVAHPTLVGPRNSKLRVEQEKKSLQMTCLLQELKENSSALLEDEELKEIIEMSKTYSELMKNLPLQNNVIPEASVLSLDKHIKNLSKLIHPETHGDDSEANSRREMDLDNIGSRRARIKSDAFAARAFFRQLNPTDEDEDEEHERLTRSRAQRKTLSRKAKMTKDYVVDDEDEDEDSEKEVKIKRQRKPRIPKEKRRVGRPSKSQRLERMVFESVYEAPDDNELKSLRKRGPVSRGSYLDPYIEEPFSSTLPDRTLSFSSSEEETIDEPDKEVKKEGIIHELENEEIVGDPEKEEIVGDPEKEEIVEDQDEEEIVEDSEEEEYLLTF